MYNVAIVGASGYTGGELLRMLLNHSEVEVNDITSRKRYVVKNAVFSFSWFWYV